jgi:putative ATP-binding cassette transporter
MGGLATAWLLAAINAGLHAENAMTVPLLLHFAGLCLLSVGGSAVASIGNSIVGQKVIAALRKDISARIIRAPLAAIERQRSYRLMAVLTNDVDTVSAFTFNFSGYAVAFSIVVGSIVYLLVLSPISFLLVVTATILGIGVNIYAKRGWIRDYEGVRTATDSLQKQYRAIIDGAKELRLNRERSSRVHRLLLSGAANRIADLKIRAMRLFWLADAAGSAIFFAVIGVLLIVQHALKLDTGVISGTVLVLLYVKGPVEQIASGLPVLSQAQVSLRRIAAVSADFNAEETSSPERISTPASFNRSIDLCGVSYSFRGPDGRPQFELGPIDLTIRQGETLFIVGENGSGKTTAIKLILGLYAPTSGRIELDGSPLQEDSMDDYRQLFSAVFSDYFLFDDLVAADPDLARQAESYLARLEIGHKVRIEDGAFTTTDLSSGQRKRLALIHAYLERRPIMMFDEWAADQDPAFRRIFYTELLPDLKQQGKTLIVVSHDDRYFGFADRIIRLQEGKIAEEIIVTRQDAAAAEVL